MSSNNFKREQVVEIINSVIKTVSDKDTSIQENLNATLHELHQAISDMRQDLSDLYPEAIRDEHIPSATDELDAVIKMTESATNDILNSCDNLQKLASSAVSEEMSKKIVDEATAIIQACTFQDITGQRVVKTIKMLRKIDAKTSELLQLLQKRFADWPPIERQKDTKEKEVNLMEGPQLPGMGISQDDIDRLLQQFN